MPNGPTRLGQILLARGDITGEQLDIALAFQHRHGAALGECLIHLGFVEHKQLRKALLRQTWLRPCAACLTCLMAPFSLPCSADESNTYEFSSDWIEHQDNYRHGWTDGISLHSSQHSHGDFLKAAADKAWDLYQGEAIPGEWRYSLSESSGGYAVNMEVRF